MGLLSGTASCCRYRIDGKFPTVVDDDLIERLAARAFGRVAGGADGAEVGWISGRHLFDTDLRADRLAFGRYLAFALRVDRVNIPAGVVKAYVVMEEDAALEATGREFLSKGERRRAREAARERAEQEARDGRFRRMQSYGVLIDLESGAVCFGNTAVGANDLFAELFRATFGVSLEPVDPRHLAYRVLKVGGRERGLDNLTPAHLAPAPDDGADGDGFAGDLGFLGREFLSWLWFRTDAAQSLSASNGDEITVMFDRSLRLDCDFGLTGSDVITADGPSSAPEARAAVAIGKQPTRAGLILGSRVGEFFAVLDAARLTLSGLRVPQEDDAADARARLEARFERIFDAGLIVDVLFEQFIRIRTGREWHGEHERMKAWARGTRPTAEFRVLSSK